MPRPPPVKRCGNCRYLDVPPDRAGRIIARSDRNYPCLWEPPALPEMPVFSAAIESSIAGLRRLYALPSPAQRQTWVDDGEDCQTYEVAARHAKKTAAAGPEPARIEKQEEASHA